MVYTAWSPDTNSSGSVIVDVESRTNWKVDGLNDCEGIVISITIASSPSMYRHPDAVTRTQMSTVSPSEAATSPSVVNSSSSGVGTGKYDASEIAVYASLPLVSRVASMVTEAGADGVTATS